MNSGEDIVTLCLRFAINQIHLNGARNSSIPELISGEDVPDTQHRDFYFMNLFSLLHEQKKIFRELSFLVQSFEYVD